MSRESSEGTGSCMLVKIITSPPHPLLHSSSNNGQVIGLLLAWYFSLLFLFQTCFCLFIVFFLCTEPIFADCSLWTFRAGLSPDVDWIIDNIAIWVVIADKVVKLVLILLKDTFLFLFIILIVTYLRYQDSTTHLLCFTPYKLRVVANDCLFTAGQG